MIATEEFSRRGLTDRECQQKISVTDLLCVTIYVGGRACTRFRFNLDQVEHLRAAIRLARDLAPDAKSKIVGVIPTGGSGIYKIVASSDVVSLHHVSEHGVWTARIAGDEIGALERAIAFFESRNPTTTTAAPAALVKEKR